MPARDSQEPRPWCLFRSESDAYAVVLEAVAEIVQVERPVRLPFSPPLVQGLCTVRRDVVPILRLSGPGPATAEDPESGDRSVVLILQTRQGTWGLKIDREGTTVAVEALDGQDRPASTQTGVVLIGSIERGGTTYTAFDPEETWRNVREGIENFYRFKAC